MWLTAVTVWLFSREGVAKSPCKCGSGDGIYISLAINEIIIPRKSYHHLHIIIITIVLVVYNTVINDEILVMKKGFCIFSTVIALYA